MDRLRHKHKDGEICHEGGGAKREISEPPAFLERSTSTSTSTSIITSTGIWQTGDDDPSEENFYDFLTLCLFHFFLDSSSSRRSIRAS